ncbi:MAG: hypothetical protein DRJ68_03115 [Thermoprotei archaeon]|nr:MAG: hypothetical protein DRJ62_03435 [Thermoprotei archaeon]RLF21580.1 MAG: hypothetical protein DRJ68_03115 [Thermoprotei archaeon]
MEARLVEVVEARLRGAGPTPKFDVYHVLKTLMLLRDGVIGRVNLSRLLGLGEGSTRTLISRLKSMGLLEESKRGCSLTDDGRRLASALADKIPVIADVDVKGFGVKGRGVGVLVRGVGQGIDVVKLRDEAVKAGAEALITLLYVDGRLSMPTVEDDVGSRWPSTAETIISTFKPSEGDAVLIGIAEIAQRAEKGALMAAWSLAFKWSSPER